MDTKDVLLIGAIGEIRAGKSTVVTMLCQMLSKKIGEDNIGAFEFSNPLRVILDILFLSQNRENLRENLQNLGNMLRETFGEFVIANAIANQIMDSKKTVTIVGGIRMKSDLHLLDLFPNHALIYVTADAETRRARDHKTEAQFYKEAQAKTEIEVEEISAHANYKIVNNGNLDDLYKQVQLVYGDLIKKI